MQQLGLIPRALCRMRKASPKRPHTALTALSHKAKGHQFDFRSGHMPGLWLCKRQLTSHTLMFFSISPSLPLSLKTNK